MVSEWGSISWSWELCLPPQPQFPWACESNRCVLRQLQKTPSSSREHQISGGQKALSEKTLGMLGKLLTMAGSTGLPMCAPRAHKQDLALERDSALWISPWNSSQLYSWICVLQVKSDLVGWWRMHRGLRTSAHLLSCLPGQDLSHLLPRLPPHCPVMLPPPGDLARGLWRDGD